MRKIKFRGYSTYRKEWVYGDLLHLPDKTCINWYEDDNDVECYRRPVFPESVGQLTDFEDSHHCSIYEGDILSDGQVELTVEYFEGAFYGRRKDGTIHLIDMLYYLKPALQSKWTVTGNVFEKKHVN